MYKNQEIGKFGEEVATKYLQNLGYEIVDRNFFVDKVKLI